MSVKVTTTLKKKIVADSFEEILSEVHNLSVDRDNSLSINKLNSGKYYTFFEEEYSDDHEEVIPVNPPVLQSLSVTENGTYNPQSGYDGFDTVNVNVPPVEVEKIVEVPVEVEVPAQPVLQNKTITENGNFTADEGYDGFGNIVVNVPEKTGMKLEFSNPNNKFDIYMERGTITYGTEVSSTSKSFVRLPINQTDYDVNRRNVEFTGVTGLNFISFSPDSLITVRSIPNILNNELTISGDEILSYTIMGMPGQNSLADDPSQYFGTVIVLDTVKYIQRRAIYNAQAYIHMYFKSIKPCKLEEEAFYTPENMSGHLIIYVPYSADHSVLNAYKTADGWSNYANIIYESDSE